MFAVQRVNDKFDGRRQCVDRTYHYYLPAQVIGLAFDDSLQDSERIARLRDTLQLFVGTHPFHNFTKRCVPWRRSLPERC